MPLSTQFSYAFPISAMLILIKTKLMIYHKYYNETPYDNNIDIYILICRERKKRRNTPMFFKFFLFQAGPRPGYSAVTSWTSHHL